MPAKYIKTYITKEKLDSEPYSYFLFGDSYERSGTKGASSIRSHPRTISFITRKNLNDDDSAYFKPQEYIEIFFTQLDFIEKEIKKMQNVVFYISKLGGGGANKYGIWTKLIRANLVETLEKYDNVVFCWDKADEPILDVAGDPEKYEKIEMTLDELKDMQI
jgi:hypothetical protein